MTMTPADCAWSIFVLVLSTAVLVLVIGLVLDFKEDIKYHHSFLISSTSTEYEYEYRLRLSTSTNFMIIIPY